jgi:hypothetical protein
MIRSGTPRRGMICPRVSIAGALVPWGLLTLSVTAWVARLATVIHACATAGAMRPGSVGGPFARERASHEVRMRVRMRVEDRKTHEEGEGDGARNADRQMMTKEPRAMVAGCAKRTRCCLRNGWHRRRSAKVSGRNVARLLRECNELQQTSRRAVTHFFAPSR